MPASTHSPDAEKFVVSRKALEALPLLLRGEGYEVWAPTPVDGAITYQSIETLTELPVGRSDQQAPGKYRLAAREDRALFQYASTPQSWKPLLLPPVNHFLTIQETSDGIEFHPHPPPLQRRALLGLRPCDLAAIRVLDRVLQEDLHPDIGYAGRREGLLLIAVNCGYPSGVCFCASMGTGPQARDGFDLALTEILAGEHRFVVTVGSARGRAILESLDHRPAEAPDRGAEDNVVRSARENMGRALNLENLAEAISSESNSKQWEEIAARCLSCANCTMVCPTCFCGTVEDHNTLDGKQASRTRVWDSCFSLQYSYIHGGSVRSSPAARYRQWLTHKLSTWHDQYGECGCVGCGRCITWCPVGIDLTQEANRLRGAAAWGGI
ncbi:MAG: 4Fe-4S dicluster domain-containing protein [Bryobacterales bacterium]|jgi:ferredoxin|nr:4Fe-4S dicluster domain-containing protein [Bryobacterales bacterium]